MISDDGEKENVLTEKIINGEKKIVEFFHVVLVDPSMAEKT